MSYGGDSAVLLTARAGRGTAALVPGTGIHQTAKVLRLLLSVTILAKRNSRFLI